MEQIERIEHGDSLPENGMERLLKYGIACCKKKCGVQIAGFPEISGLLSVTAIVLLSTGPPVVLLKS